MSRTGWTESDDAAASCDGPLGAVGDDETVARLRHNRNSAEGYDPFTRTELFGRRRETPSNECGASDGGSVDRCGSLTDREVLRRAEAFASQKPGRMSEGAKVGSVAALRGVRLRELPGQQLLFVYDDPSPDNAEHAVVRGVGTTDRPLQSAILAKVDAAFARLLRP